MINNEKNYQKEHLLNIQNFLKLPAIEILKFVAGFMSFS